MRVMGLSSGTSRDGIDIVVAEFAPEAESRGVVAARVLWTGEAAYGADLGERLAKALAGPCDLRTACELDTEIGQAFAAAATAARGECDADAICSHGQTVYHWVDRGRALGTLQIGQPAWIAEATGLPVVADVRPRDVAAGGQGAPLVAMLDLLVMAELQAQDPTARPVALNLGGIANITVASPPLAYDTGPANSLMDAAIAERVPEGPGYDKDGELAAAGAVDEDLLAELLAHRYFALPAPKSTGLEEFGGPFLAETLARRGRIDTENLLATLAELTAASVAAEVSAVRATRLIASGGGARNPHLMGRIAARLPGVRVGLSDDVGLPCDSKEAIAFALIGYLTLNGLPGSVPACTGARGSRVLGSITPGAGALPDRELAAPPTALRVAPRG